jgi:hypothetical protein
MKLFKLYFLLSILTVNAQAADLKPEVEPDFRAQESFVETCPEQFLTYIDKAEGGPGAYCACPDENVTYIDKSEGGPGLVCIAE